MDLIFNLLAALVGIVFLVVLVGVVIVIKKNVKFGPSDDKDEEPTQPPPHQKKPQTTANLDEERIRKMINNQSSAPSQKAQQHDDIIRSVLTNVALSEEALRNEQTFSEAAGLAEKTETVRESALRKRQANQKKEIELNAIQDQAERDRIKRDETARRTIESQNLAHDLNMRLAEKEVKKGGSLLVKLIAGLFIGGAIFELSLLILSRI